MGEAGSACILCEAWMVDSTRDVNLVHCTPIWADLSLEELHSNCLASLQCCHSILTKGLSSSLISCCYVSGLHVHAGLEAACAFIQGCCPLGMRVPCYHCHHRYDEVYKAKQCLTMSAAKTSPDAPSPNDAPMPKASTVICLIASRGGGARAQQAFPARDTQARDWHCASSSGTCQGPHTWFEHYEILARPGKICSSMKFLFLPLVPLLGHGLQHMVVS